MELERGCPASQACTGVGTLPLALPGADLEPITPCFGSEARRVPDRLPPTVPAENARRGVIREKGAEAVR